MVALVPEYNPEAESPTTIPVNTWSANVDSPNKKTRDKPSAKESRGANLVGILNAFLNISVKIKTNVIIVVVSIILFI